MEEQTMRDLLCECACFIGRKIKDGTVTASDVRTMFDTLSSTCGVDASIREIARHFGQSEVNVRSLIKRRILGKPRRRVYYDFNEVCRKVPSSWLAKRSLKDG